MARQPHILRLVISFLILSAWPSASWAHIGGSTPRLDFVSPEGLVFPVDDIVSLKWSDGDSDPVASHHFFFQATNSTPEPVPETKHLKGEFFHQVEVLDIDNILSWDTSEVPQGAYFIYAETTDEPNCPSVRFADSLVVIDRNQSEPPLTGIWFETPTKVGMVADENAPIIVRAIGPKAPMVEIHAGYTAIDYESEPEGSPCLYQRSKWVQDFEVLASSKMVADPDLGEGFWRFEFDWDTSRIANDAFLLSATIRLENGVEKSAFAPGWISIFHPNGLPAEPSTGGCSVVTESSSGLFFWLLLLGGLTLQRHRRLKALQ